ncbi:MAG: carboxyl transferase domain-containing protein [Frankia sp.]
MTAETHRSDARANQPATTSDRPPDRRAHGAGSAAGADDPWRSALLAGIALRDPGETAPDRLRWPGYAPRTGLRWGAGTILGHPAVAAVWNFGVFGGSFGEAEATGLAEAAAAAAAARVPLVTFLRSGGTRLQEGVAGLVGLPRATLALGRLARAGQPHIAVVDHPTTGGAWVTIGCRADLRVALDGATVGFAGPRVVEAMTGLQIPPGSHTARTAFEAGLVDAVTGPTGVAGWLEAALASLAPRASADDGREPRAPGNQPPDGRSHRDVPHRGGWEQVLAARSAPRPAPRSLLAELVRGGVELHEADGSVAARTGRLAGHAGAPDRPVVGVALAAERDGRPSPAGYRLLTRAAELADRLGLPLITLVDTPGAEPGPDAEASGIAPAIGEAMGAVLGCRSPTVAVLVGEGGSGGALAATCADLVLVGPDGYLTALSPEGTAVTLRISPRQAADHAGLRPADLIALGLADAVTPDPTDPAFGSMIATALERLETDDQAVRLAAREVKWSTPLTGRL